MAFDAGAIEATLTLNRNPFTAGLAAAKAQVDQWKRRNSPIEVDIKVNLRDSELKAIEAKLKRFGAIVAKATAEIVVKGRAEFDKLLFDLKWFDKRKFTATIDVNAKRAAADVIAFRTLLSSLNDQTVNLRANTRGFGSDAVRSFGEGQSRFERLATAFIGLLPVIASGFTAAVGAVGAFTSGLLIAGLGAGALALVAVPAIKSVWKAANEGQEAVNKLPPALQAAGNAALGMQNAVKKLTADTQLMVGVGLANWFKAGATAIGTLTPLVSSAAVAFGNAGVKAQQFFQSPWWQQFVDFLSRSIGPAVDMLFRGIFALIQIVGNLTEAFWKLGGSQILEMITKGLEDFATYTERIGNNKTFQEFMDAAVRSLPVVGHLLGDLIVFIFKLATGLEPLGTLIIRVLNGIFDAVNSLPPSMLAALAFGFAAVWAAIALGAGGPVALAIGVLAGLAVVFTNAYTKSQTLRDGINDLIVPIRDWFLPLAKQLGDIWDQKVIPAWDRAVAATRENLIPVFEYLWHMFQDNVLPALSGLASTFTGTLLPAILDFWTAIQPFVAFVVKAFGEDIIYAIQLVVSTFDGAFKAIAGLLNIFTGLFTGDWTKFHEGIQQVTEGFWTVIAGIFGMSLDELKVKMQQWSTEEVFTWQGLWDTIKIGAGDFFDWFNKGWIKLWKDSADEAKVWGGTVAASFQHDFLDVMKGGAGDFFKWFVDGWVKLWTDTESEQHTWSGRITSSFQRDFIDVITGKFNDFSGWFTRGWTEMGAALKREWDSWAGFLASAFRTLVDNARTGANSVIDELNRLIGAVNGFLSSLGVGGIPSIQHLESGGTLDGGSVPGMAAGGRVGGGFTTNGPMAIVGEGNPRYPEYVIPTDPKYRSRAQGLYSSLGPQLMASGGILSIPANLAGGAQAAVDGIINSLTSSMGWKWGEIAVAVAHKASSAMVAKIQAGINAVMAAIAAAAAAVTGAFGGGGGGGDARAWIIAHESGGNPRAQNPTSSASGLYQFIDGTWRSLGGSTAHAKDASVAEQNAIADRYVAQRYGSWEGAKAFWQSHGWYDNGGILPTGTSIATNNTGRPEAILTQAQLSAFTSPSRQSLTVEDVLALLNSRDDGVGGSGDVYNVMLPERASVRELADQLDFKRRVVSKGRYR